MFLMIGLQKKREVKGCEMYTNQFSHMLHAIQIGSSITNRFEKGKNVYPPILLLGCSGKMRIYVYIYCLRTGSSPRVGTRSCE